MNVIVILITLLVGAIVTLIFGKKMAFKTAVSFSVVSFVFTLLSLNAFVQKTDVSYVAQWMEQPNISFALKADGLSMLMLLLNTTLTPIILLVSAKREWKNPHILYSLVLFMSFAMAGTFLASDGFLYYIFWELSLLPIFFIALYWGEGLMKDRKPAILKFFIYTFAGSLFMLVAFVYLYRYAGSFMWNEFQLLNLSSKEQTWIFLAFFLAYAIKIPVFPFHTWQADTYQKAPFFGTMLLSGIMLKMGLYSVLRWQLPITRGVDPSVLNIVIVLCLIGVVYASLIALKQSNLKRLLAYSSMAHVGLIAAGAYTYTEEGYQGVVVQMLAHGVVVVALFYLAEILYTRFGTYNIYEMGGIRSQAIKFTSYCMIFMFASIGLPGTFSFIGEFSLLLGLSKYSLVAAIFGGTTIILGAYYMMKMFQIAVLGKQNEKTFADLSTGEQAILFVLAAIVIFFGIFPKPIIDLINLV